MKSFSVSSEREREREREMLYCYMHRPINTLNKLNNAVYSNYNNQLLPVLPEFIITKPEFS